MTTGRVIPGAILIILGALFLAANFGYLDWSFVASLWQLWPLLVIIFGVQLLFGSRNQWLAAVLVLAVLVGGAALVILGGDRWFDSADLQTTRIEGPALDGVRDAEVRIDMGAARLEIGSQPGGATATGTFESRRDPEVKHNVSNGTYTLEVRQKNSVRIFPFDFGRDRLNLDLAEGVPWKIDLNTGAADVNLDLTGLTLRELSLDAGASSVDLTVGPDVAGNARVVIGGGAGSYRLRLPRDLDITLTTDTGLSSTDVDSGFRKDGDVYRHTGTGDRLSVDINAGVSSIKVELY